MLISDWSSDVCSSDLRHQKFVLFAGREIHAAGLPEAGIRSPKSDGKIPADLVVFQSGSVTGDDNLAALQQDEAVGEFPGELEILLDQHNRHGAAVGEIPDDPADILDDGGLDALGRFVQRSEEHTSEHQSLM